MSENVENISDADFEQAVIKSDVPVLVDFWAPWCGPCKMVGPVLEQIAAQYQGRAKVVKVNVDDNKQIAGSLGIQSIPTVVLYKDGEVVEKVIGARPKGDFETMLNNAV
ncbi:MAG: thioredoxin [Proteobacteria bacterium]|nr:thioredoxin [Pseudomonadota bacterium]